MKAYNIKPIEIKVESNSNSFTVYCRPFFIWRDR